MAELERDYIALAHQLSSNGSYSKAVDFYILAFDKNPEIKTEFENEFRSVLIKLNEILAMANKMEDIFFNFGRAIKAFPSNYYLLNDIGKYLYKFGYYTEAWCHFQKALRFDSGFVNAEKNLNSVKNLLVERWHFRMLNDKIRNKAYHDAIQDTLVPYRDSVLDLGTGTGLLAMFAVECSPTAVTGCDGSEIMSKMAEVIVQDNRMPEIVVVNKMSTNMNYRDIGGKRSLLVTEMFDAGLFGEHILQTLCHAREELIINTAKVVPNRAEFFIICAKCDHLYLKYQLCDSIKSLLNIPSMNVHTVSYSETYDCEDVHLFKDLKYMTDAQSLVKVDFNDYFDLQYKLNSIEPYSVKLKALEAGEINNVIGFFNLYLTDNITLTTDPRSKNRANAWQQAIFLNNLPERVEENQIIDIEFIIKEGKLTMLSNWDGFITTISPETVRFLNDSEYINMITKCIGMASVYLGQIAEMSQINIVDLCPFPYFGLLMLKRGAQSVTCSAKSTFEKRFFKKVFKANNVPMSKITILMGDKWNHEVFHDEKYHAVFCNIFELGGEVDLRLREIAENLKNAHLLQGGLFMPANITMMGQLVNSHWLDINNRVYDKNVHGYKIATHMNKYQVSQNFCIDFTCLDYKPITNPAAVGPYTGGMISEVFNVPILRNDDANAILCWYNIELMEGLGELTTYRGNCFIDGTVFLANPPVPMVCGELANILRCVDPDGSFKLMIDVEAT